MTIIITGNLPADDTVTVIDGTYEHENEEVKNKSSNDNITEVEVSEPNQSIEKETSSFDADNLDIEPYTALCKGPGNLYLNNMIQNCLVKRLPLEISKQTGINVIHGLNMGC